MTEEIVERLKTEGQLIRNTGTNSIRAVRIQMDRFESIFETISEQVTMQTRLLATMAETSMDKLKIDEETSEREKARQQREDLAADQEESKKESTKEDSEKSKKEGPGFFSMLGGMGISNLLIGGALLGAGMFAAYNFAKGFIDEKYDNAWSNFEQGLVDFIKSIDLEALKDAFNNIIVGLVGLSTAIGALRLTLLGLQISNMLKGGPRVSPGSGAGFGTFLRGAGRVLRKAIPGLGFVIPTEMGDSSLTGPAQERLAAQGITPPAESLRNIAPDLYDQMHRNYQEQLEAEMARFTEEASKIAAEEIAAADAARTPEEEARLEVLREQNIEQDRITAEIRRNADLLESANDSIENLGFTVGGIQFRGTDLSDMRASLGDAVADAFTETMSYKANPYNIETALEVLRNRVLGGNELTPEETRFMEALREATGNRGYRRGTNGFQDFGPASFAILHGKEAVVPKETPAGRFLEQFFNEDWSPKMSGASSVSEQVSTVASGGVNVMTVNSNPIYAPVVNNVQGGPNVNAPTIIGSGGGDRSRGTYGISNAGN